MLKHLIPQIPSSHLEWINSDMFTLDNDANNVKNEAEFSHPWALKAARLKKTRMLPKIEKKKTSDAFWKA